MTNTDKLAEEVKATIQFEFNWLETMLFAEGRINLAALDIAEQTLKAKVVELIKDGEQE